MLVLKINDGEHVTIYDQFDGSIPPIKIAINMVNGKPRLVIGADNRFRVVRSDAKCKVASRKAGGTDAKPIPA